MELKWDRRYMQMAKLVASWSKDPSTKIGAVLVRNNRVITVGFNGFPESIADDDRLHDREKKYPLVVHGEMNAILRAGSAASGTTMYLYSPFGGFPCQNCTKHLITAGVERVVACEIRERNPRWADDCAAAEETLREAGVRMTTIHDGEVLR